jgi:hypothetical protein
VSNYREEDWRRGEGPPWFTAAREEMGNRARGRRREEG